MYVVREIMNTQTGERYKGLVMSSTFHFNKLDSGTLITNTDACKYLKVCVSDSLFGDKKWYTIPDINNLLEDINKGFIGYNLYNNTHHSDLMNSIVNGAVLTLNVAFEGYSDEEIKKVLRYKFVGFDIDNFGRVTKVPASTVKDGILIIPDELKRLSSKVQYTGGSIDYDTISVGCNFDIDDEDSSQGLSWLAFRFGRDRNIITRE